MTKWDTIQADVADMYVGKIENEEYYASQKKMRISLALLRLLKLTI